MAPKHQCSGFEPRSSSWEYRIRAFPQWLYEESNAHNILRHDRSVKEILPEYRRRVAERHDAEREASKASLLATIRAARRVWNKAADNEDKETMFAVLQQIETYPEDVDSGLARICIELFIEDFTAQCLGPQTKVGSGHLKTNSDVPQPSSEDVLSKIPSSSDDTAVQLVCETRGERLMEQLHPVMVALRRRTRDLQSFAQEYGFYLAMLLIYSVLLPLAWWANKCVAEEKAHEEARLAKLERQEAERQEAERQEAERRAAERREAERQEAELQEAKRQQCERRAREVPWASNLWNRLSTGDMSQKRQYHTTRIARELRQPALVPSHMLRSVSPNPRNPGLYCLRKPSQRPITRFPRSLITLTQSNKRHFSVLAGAGTYISSGIISSHALRVGASAARLLARV